MADYIKKENALQAVIDCWEPWFGSYPAGDIVRCPYFAINKIPSEDVQPVVHGEWEVFDEPDTNAYECTACHDVFWLSDGTPFENNYNFCPNCGADMRGGT